MQKLILPFITNNLEAGYKNKHYKNYWGYAHYGIDLTGEKEIYSIGNGQVLYIGYDNSGGNTVIIQYDDVDMCNGKTQNLIARFMHFENILVKKGENVTTQTILGTMGGTPYTSNGEYRFSPHLHLELDTDTEHPRYSPQVSSRDDKKTIEEGNLLIHGIDTTVSPMKILHRTKERRMKNSVYSKDKWFEAYEITPQFLAPTGKADTKKIINKLSEIEKLIKEIYEELQK